MREIDKSRERLRDLINQIDDKIPEMFQFHPEDQQMIIDLCKTEAGTGWNTEQAIQVSYILGFMRGLEAGKIARKEIEP